MICDGGYYYALTRTERRDIPPQGYPLFILSCGFSKLLTQKICRTIHAPRADYQLIYLHKGCLHYYDRNQNEHILPEGSFLIFTPNEHQDYILYLDEAPEMYWCHFSGEYAHTLLEKYHLDRQRVFSPIVSERYVPLFDQMRKTLQDKPSHYIDLCTLYFQELVILLSDGVSGGTEMADYPAAYREALSYINDHYFEDITLDDLARNCYTNYKSLLRYFMKYQNTTPIRCLNDVRLRRSVDLLAQTSLRIKEISVAVGYHDPLYFTKAFTRKYGRSPKEYRAYLLRNEQ